MNRRSLLKSALLALAARRLPLPPGSTRAGQEQNPAWRHGLSLFGDLKYPAGFKQFDYVNANAPKGGTVREISHRHLRQFQYGGRRRQRRARRQHPLIYDTLLTSSLDEVSTEYGLLAEAVSYPDDFSSGYLPAARRSEMARRQAGHGPRT